MRIETRNVDGVFILDVHDEIHRADYSAIYTAVDDHLREKGDGGILLNLSDVPRFDSSGVRGLVDFHISLNNKGVRFGLLGVGRGLKKLLLQTQLSSCLNIYDEKDRAIADLNQK